MHAYWHVSSIADLRRRVERFKPPEELICAPWGWMPAVHGSVSFVDLLWLVALAGARSW
jgi:hypothetical protein